MPLASFLSAIAVDSSSSSSSSSSSIWYLVVPWEVCRIFATAFLFLFLVGRCGLHGLGLGRVQIVWWLLLLIAIPRLWLLLMKTQ